MVLGAGKAAAAMAQAVEAHWPGHAPLTGLVITRYGHVPPRPAGLVQRIEVVEAAHPVPDAAGLAASQRILGMAAGLSESITKPGMDFLSLFASASTSALLGMAGGAA